MDLTGTARMAGYRSGKTKDGDLWGAVYLDDPNNLMNRVQIFVRDNELRDACEMLAPGSDVDVTVHLYAGSKGLGSTLLSIVPVDAK